MNMELCILTMRIYNAYIYIHTHTHIYIHIYIYIHICVCKPKLVKIKTDLSRGLSCSQHNHPRVEVRSHVEPGDSPKKKSFANLLQDG
jgi:hypothetical protein